MAGSTSHAESTRPTIAIALAEPERSEIVAALAEAGFDAIALPPGAPLAEAFGSTTKHLVAVIDIAGDLAAAAAIVSAARRGRPGALSVVYVATEQDLDALQNAHLDEKDELILRPFNVETVR